MLRYFPCTIEKDVEDTKGSEDSGEFDSKPKPTGSTMKPNDEKPGATEVTKTPRSKGRGNRKMNTSKEMLRKPRLVDLVNSTADQIKSNRPKDKDNSHPGDRKRKDFDGDDDEKMDTSENDVGDTTELDEGTTDTTADGKGKGVFNKEQI